MPGRPKNYFQLHCQVLVCSLRVEIVELIIIFHSPCSNYLNVQKFLNASYCTEGAVLKKTVITHEGPGAERELKWPGAGFV